jgi:hypothetical protein
MMALSWPTGVPRVRRSLRSQFGAHTVAEGVKSAFVNVPVLKSGYGTLITVMKDGSTQIGEGAFYKALAKIARLNAGAAICAFFSALTQAITLFQRK